MFSKLYESIKKIFLKNIVFISILLIFVLLLNIKLPYKISTPGGFINVTKRVVYDDAYDSSGSFNMAYVSEYDASIPMYLLALVIPNWDLEKNSDYLLENDSVKNYEIRGKLALKEASNNALYVAFSRAGLDYKINSYNYYIAYVDSSADTDLVVGDEIVSVDGKKIYSKSEISEAITSKGEGEEISFSVVNDGKNYERRASVKKVNDRLQIGVVIYEILDLVTDPEVRVISDNSESGPSGGLMTSLAIYNALVEEDITHGKKIVGTGTIDRDGNVGSIGGVKYKILGAAKKGAKIFLIPSGENYEEALKIVKDNKLDIELVAVSTFDEALDYLNNL